MRMADPLNAIERQALNDALDDEYKSHATYRQVIADHGPIRPFINIVEAEARHIRALLDLFAAYGIAAPADRWTGATPRFASVRDACVSAVQGEIDNVALYDKLLASTRRPDILAVYHALRAASLDRHLPAFQRCAQRRL